MRRSFRKMVRCFRKKRLRLVKTALGLRNRDFTPSPQPLLIKKLPDPAAFIMDKKRTATDGSPSAQFFLGVYS